MRSRALALRYARALASSLATEAEVETTLGELRALSGVLRATPRVKELFEDPALSEDRRRALAKEVTGAVKLSDKTTRFFTLLVEQDRMPILDDVVVLFQEIRDQRLGYVSAEVTTAVPLDAAQEAAWTKRLADLTGKKVQLTKRVNPDIIGGAVARVGSKVYDGSLKSRLEALRAQLRG